MRFLLLMLANLVAKAAITQIAPCAPLGSNLIVNPAFEQGYYGFTSDFGRGVNNATRCNCATQGWILVTNIFPHTDYSCQQYPAELSAQYGGPNTQTNPNPGHASNKVVAPPGNCNIPLPDHSSGSGYFLTIDPDGCPDRSYWKQNLYICPNTLYYFSVWVRNISGNPAPTFHFEIDQKAVTQPNTFSENQWTQCSAIWFSAQTEGLVTMELVNDLPGCIANDVAIDDLYFGVCGGVALSCPTVFRFCPNDANVLITLSGHALGLNQAAYQWEKQEPGSNLWLPIPGAVDTMLMLTEPGADAAGRYRLAAAESGNIGQHSCSVFSPPILLDPHPVYNIVDTVNICEGQSYKGRQQSGLYVERYLSQQGCDSTRTLDLRVRGGLDWYMPTAFSPNDDGLNDRISPQFSNLDMDDFLWQTFDRWGNLVFESKKPSLQWDGYARGKPCPAGVYVYHIRFKIEGCEMGAWSGEINLIR